MKRQLARNTMINYAKTAITYTIRLVMVPIVLRELGVTVYGIFVLAGSIFAPSDFLQSGIGLSVAKQVAEARARGDSNIDRVVSTSLAVMAAIGVVFVTALVVFVLVFFNRVFNIPAEYQSLVRVYSLLSIAGFAIGFPLSLFLRVLESAQRYDLIALTEVFTEALRLVLFLGVLSTGSGLVGLGYANVAIATAVVLLAYVLMRQTFPALRISVREIDRRDASTVYSFSWKVMASKFSAFLGDRINPWIVGAFLPVASVTPYNIANQVHSVGRLVPTLAGSATLPLASELYAVDDEQRLAGLYIKIVKYTAAFSLPFILAGMILARPLIASWLGSEFAGAAPLARAYLSYLLVYLQVFAAGGLMIGTERFVKVLKPMYVATAINVVLSVVLVQRIGVMGVIVGSVVGNLIVWAAYTVVAFRDFEIDRRRFADHVLARAYLPAVPVYLGLWALVRTHEPSGFAWTVAYGAAAAAVYWLVFLVLGLDAGEKADVRTGVRELASRLGIGSSA